MKTLKDEHDSVGVICDKCWNNNFSIRLVGDIDWSLSKCQRELWCSKCREPIGLVCYFDEKKQK